MKATERFESRGLVYGNLWGGGQGAYKAKRLQAKTREELLEQALKGLDGSLDGGMGFESLIGALLEIKKITTIVVKGKTFTNEEIEDAFIGDLTEEQQEFLQHTGMYV
jgi:hypothetical protein